MSKLFVGNLAYSTTEEELNTLFSQAGTVTSVNIVKDRETGNSRGFAFVEMGSQQEAEEAIRQFNGYRLGNRELKVDVAKPPRERDEGGFGGPRRGGAGGGRGGQDRGWDRGDRDRDRGPRPERRGGPQRY